MTGYWSEGRFVTGTTLRTAGNGGVSTLDLEIAAAVARARDDGNALGEMRRLLSNHPLLRRESAEHEEHPLALLARLSADQQLGAISCVVGVYS